MQYSHSLDKAIEISQKVSDRLQEVGLPPTPEIYELWYVYFADMNPEVTRAIDILAANEQRFTKERCQELHQRFLSDAKENERVHQASDKIQETIKGVTGAVSNVKSATSQYNSTLETARKSFDTQDMSKDDMQKILSMVMHDTNDMITKNKKLEEELMKSSSVMQELRRDLEMVRKEALTDGLTNLANRKAFDAEIQTLIEEARKGGVALSLIMMDIDHFKSFNDNFGHQIGDQVLRLVARTLTDGVKGRDIACRYGGEEFAILLPETNIQGALMVGNALRKTVASKDIINRATGEKIAQITLSGGAAEYVDKESIEGFISRADAALYAAKNGGRNQIAAAPAPGAKKVSG